MRAWARAASKAARLGRQSAVPTIARDGTLDAAHVAVRDANTAMAQLLIDWGAEVNAIGDWPEEYTPLHIAVLAENTEMAQLLVDSGADINATGGRSRSPLEIAVERNDTAMVRILTGVSS